MKIILDCDVVVHKQCTSSLVDYCYPAAQKKAGMSKSKQRSTSGGKYEVEGSERIFDQHPTTFIGSLERAQEKVC